jgi:hypothetical protein
MRYHLGRIRAALRTVYHAVASNPEPKEVDVEYTKILKQAWQITWRHRALWLFGFLFSLFSARGGSRGGSGMQYTLDLGERLPAWSGLAIAFVAVFGLLLLLLGLAVRYLSRAALIGMVREAEETDWTSVRSGWRIGWSRFLPLLGIDLVIGVPAVMATLLLVGVGLAPLVLLVADESALTIVAIVATVLLMLVVIGLLFFGGLILSVLGELAHRQCVLEGKGVFDSLRDGYQLGRENLSQVGLVWVLLVGTGLAFGAITVPVAAVAFGVAGAPAAAYYAATGGVVGSVLLGFLFALPGMLLFSLLGGVYEVFRSAVWTLTYLEL